RRCVGTRGSQLASEKPDLRRRRSDDRVRGGRSACHGKEIGVNIRLVPMLILIAGLVIVFMTAQAADVGLRPQAQGTFKALPKDMATADNPLTLEKIKLGRLLYFEPRASADGTVSCARCHQPALFGTDALPKAIGAEHRLNPRNAPTVLNA